MKYQSTRLYQAPFFLPGGHLQTIYPSLFRKINSSFYQRERIFTTDDDFLDLDWSLTGHKNLAIISHGLEGSTHRPYVLGMIRALCTHGWNALAWNFRSCSEEINRRLRFYHNGATDDLDQVVRHASAKNQYEQIALIGFSMGGNLSLVYLGQGKHKTVTKLSKAIVFSVPSDLKASSERLARPINAIYMKRFLASLHKKVIAKMALFPDQIDDRNYHQIRNFKEFDDRYTAPIHGFKDAEEYWRKCSGKQFIPNIRIPTLIINAANDPFLSKECFPVREAENSRFVVLETPSAGGHVGFVSFNKAGLYWSEKRTLDFLKLA
jgi:predicted alpha/beta-fold hydrolase